MPLAPFLILSLGSTLPQAAVIESEVTLFSMRLKVVFATVFSCLALVLGQFSSTGVASAHSTQALQSQASASTLAEDRGRVRCRTFTTVNQRFSGFEDQNTGAFIPNGHVVFFHGQRGDYVTGSHGRTFHRVVSRRFERVTIVTICGNHRTQRIVNRVI